MVWTNQNKTWSDRFIPQIQRIVGLNLAYMLFPVAVEEEDRDHNSDLITLEMTGVRIACRVRREIGLDGTPYLQKYGDQFTIRAVLPRSGNKTELDKIIEGWGRFLFYGFANESIILQWKIGDLNVFRTWYHNEMIRNNGKEPGNLISNGDGSSDFRAYKWASLPTEFVVAPRSREVGIEG